MAGATKLVEKILSEAKRQAEGNVRDAEEQAEKVLAKARDDAKAASAELLAKADRDADARAKRMISVAELDGRKERLATKQKLIEELFAAAVDKLQKMPAAEYAKLLQGMIVEAASGGEEIALSKGDLEKLPATFLDDVNKALAAAGKPKKLTAAKAPGNIDGGFVLRSGDVEVNHSFASLVKMRRDELEALAVKMLF